MITKEIMEYIRLQRTLGKSDAEIRSVLISQGGWQSSDLDGAFGSPGFAQKIIAETNSAPILVSQRTGWKAFGIFLLGVIVSVAQVSYIGLFSMACGFSSSPECSYASLTYIGGLISVAVTFCVPFYYISGGCMKWVVIIYAVSCLSLVTPYILTM